MDMYVKYSNTKFFIQPPIEGSLRSSINISLYRARGKDSPARQVSFPNKLSFLFLLGKQLKTCSCTHDLTDMLTICSQPLWQQQKKFDDI